MTSPAAYGGLERVVAGLSASIAARGHRVVLVTVLEPASDVPAWALALEPLGVTVEPVFVSGRAYRTERRAVRSILRRHGAEIVHTHGYRSDVIDGAVARGAGLPVVSTAHGFVRLGMRGRLYSWLQVRALRHFDAVVAVSRPLLDELRLAGVPASRLRAIPNGFVSSTSRSLSRVTARNRLGLPLDALVVGWVGRMSEEKGPDLALEAFTHVTGPRVMLCMIGDGSRSTHARALAERLGLTDRVVFSGSRPDADTYLHAFDLLALSSRTEGTPMVLLEAGWARIPIVATAVGGVPDLLGNDRGILVSGFDPRSLGEAIARALADQDGSRARAERLRTAIEAGETSESWIDEYEALYRELVGAQQGGGQASTTVAFMTDRSYGK